MKRLGTALGVTVAVMMHPSVARADLRVERAEGADACPDPAVFAARVRESLTTTHPSKTIIVRFARTSSGSYTSAVRTADGMERVLDDRANGCDGLAEATLLAVRLAFDNPEPPAPSPPERDAANPPPMVTAPDEHPTHLEVLAGGVATVGIGSAFAVGARGVGALSLGAHWTIGLTGFALAPRAKTLGPGEVDVGVVGGGADLCRRYRTAGNFLLGLCARAEIARLSGSARGFTRNEEAARPLFTSTLLLRAQRRFVGGFGLFAEAGGVVPIIRERFEIQGIGLVYDPPAIAMTAAIGALVDFE